MIPNPSNSDVIRSDQFSQAPIRTFLRLILIALAICLLSLLVVAGWLSPDQRGFGTHEALGLEPCVIKEQLGIRCPSCGMTTSWAYMMDGKPLESFRVNSGGALLAITSIFAVVWLTVSAIRGRWFVVRPYLFRIGFLMFVICLVTITDWIIRLST